LGCSCFSISTTVAGFLGSSFWNIPVNQLVFFEADEGSSYRGGLGSGYGSRNSAVFFHQVLVVRLIFPQVVDLDRLYELTVGPLLDQGILGAFQLGHQVLFEELTDFE
jgi:hypothetical protein